MDGAAVGGAVAPAAAAAAPAAAAGGGPLWVHRERARLARRHARDPTALTTLKFTPPQLTHDAQQTSRKKQQLLQQQQQQHALGSHGGQVRDDEEALLHASSDSSNSSGSSGSDHDHDDQRAVASNDEEEEEEHKEGGGASAAVRLGVRSLDPDEEAAARRQRRDRQRQRRAQLQHDDGDEQQRGAANARSDGAAATSSSPSSLEHYAGSLPAIVVDPSSALLAGTAAMRARPHLVVDPATVAAVPPHVVAAATCAPVPAVWTTDYIKHTLRCISADGQIHDVAGQSQQAGWADGTGTVAALMRKPRGLCIHPLSGEMFIADSANHCIRMVRSPAIVASAFRRAVATIEAESSFRALRDPTADPVEEERREKARAAAAAAAAASSSSCSSPPSRAHPSSRGGGLFPSASLSTSLSTVCDLFLPLIASYVGFDVATVAGVPGAPGCRDTALDARGRVVTPALFKFPVALAIVLTGEVITDDMAEQQQQQQQQWQLQQEREREHAARGKRSEQKENADASASAARRSAAASSSSAASSLSHSSLTASSSYELLVSDAGNGCIRRIKPNPFAPAESRGAPARAHSPFSSASASSSGEHGCGADGGCGAGGGAAAAAAAAGEQGFIVDTIQAYVPVRCCHTSWNPAPAEDGGGVDEEKENSPAAAAAAAAGAGADGAGAHDAAQASTASSSPPAPSSSFGLSLLHNLSTSPTRLLHAAAASASSAASGREELVFQYPIGIAARVQLEHGQSDLREVRTEFGTIWTVAVSGQGQAPTAAAAAAANANSIGVPVPASPPRRHASAPSLVVVDARASCIYTLQLSTGLVKRMAGSSDGGWGHRDGWASRARFCRPSGVAVDQRTGDVLVADAGNSCVRMVSARSQRVSTLAGHPHRVGCVDGPAFAASLYAPLALALTPCPLFPDAHPPAVWVAGGFRQGLRLIVRCECRWTYQS